MNAATAPARHSLFDDAQGLLTGTLFVAMALVLFRQAGLVTGGKIAVKYTGDGEPSKPGFNPPKLFEARYEAPKDSVDLDEF